MYGMDRQVGASGTGADGRLTTVAALDMMQDCSLLWIRCAPRLSDYMEARGQGILLAFRQADILRLPAYGEHVRVESWVYACKPHFGYRNTVLRDGAGEPCVVSWSLGAFVDLETGGLVRLPEDLLRGVPMGERLEMDYLPRRIAPPPGPGERLADIPVRRGDIDLYGHVNNVRYIEAVTELLPDDFSIGRLRAEYRTPARPGGILCPTRLTDGPDRQAFLLEGPAGETHAVIELIRK